MKLTSAGVLEHRDELVAHRWDDHTDGLREHDSSCRLRCAHGQSVSSFDLPVTYGLDPGTKDLGHISPVVDPKRKDPRGECSEPEDTLWYVAGCELRELREPEVDEEDLDDQRRSPN